MIRLFPVQCLYLINSTILLIFSLINLHISVYSQQKFDNFGESLPMHYFRAPYNFVILYSRVSFVF